MEINWSNQATKQLDIALDFLVEKGFASYASELNEQILLRVENLPENYNIQPINIKKSITEISELLKFTITVSLTELPRPLLK